jgi:hypothetical protein
MPITTAKIFTGTRSMATNETNEWVSGRIAQQLTGWTNYNLMKACALGKVRTRAERGSTMKFHRGDLLAACGMIGGSN